MDEKTMELLQKLSRDMQAEKEKLGNLPASSALLDFVKDGIDRFMTGDYSTADLLVTTAMQGIRTAQIIGVLEQQLYDLNGRVAAIESGG
ncbi:MULTISPECIES: hypothetical protein [Corynebacterium]|uniref:hypothetical protein n=1 Tax=Corynebacterium TaxID=1716 RepID=UPI000245A52C|nr:MULTISPECIES: hypothetical protein [Corynebacterium]OWM36447.1 hypothetical protein AZF07_09970 [Corynebacterium diphtheriae subsp. lausannense]AEX40872.1 hypothetical protein CD31A_0188 [Corynebacterium diphtheriae 31A]AWR14871.1 hypothetical protein B11Q_00153 [Corynebacterium diphtheriae]MBG9313410.1 hypothetical protein [Corynebacterium diphtheriae bv. mitis]MBN4654215.1 hypothetical protein [Corynebacterium diphtheriae bv. mitis]